MTTTAAYDTYGLPLPTTTGPYCGFCSTHTVRIRHASAADIATCYAINREQIAAMDAEIAAEQAVERHLEDRGYWAARQDEDRERAMGILSFTEAWDAESPGTRPGWHDDYCTPDHCTCRY